MPRRRDPCAGRRERRRQVDADAHSRRRRTRPRCRQDPRQRPACRIASPAEAARSASPWSIRTPAWCRPRRRADIALGHEPGGVLIDYRLHARAARTASCRLGGSVDTRIAAGSVAGRASGRRNRPRALESGARAHPRRADLGADRRRGRARCSACCAGCGPKGAVDRLHLHRLPEIFGIADRITVMKDGEIVGTVGDRRAPSGNRRRLHDGRARVLLSPSRSDAHGPVPLLPVEIAAPAARARDRSDPRRRDRRPRRHRRRRADGARPCAFRHGAGVRRNRTRRQAVVVRKPAEAIAAGIVYLPADRRGEGMFLPHSVGRISRSLTSPSGPRLGIVDLGPRGEGGRPAGRGARHQDALGGAAGRASSRAATSRRWRSRAGSFPTRGCASSTSRPRASTSEPSSRSTGSSGR